MIRSTAGTRSGLEWDPEREDGARSPEPWTQEGTYIRDATGAVVLRGRSFADARRIVAAINGTRGIPTEALESWSALDVSDPQTRPDLEVELDVTPAGTEDSPFAVPAPGSSAAASARLRERADGSPASASEADSPAIDRRTGERRSGQRRAAAERRKGDRRRCPVGAHDFRR